MRAIMAGILVAGSFGIVGASGASAAPANGLIIGQAADAIQTSEQAYYYYRRYHYGHYGYRPYYRYHYRPYYGYYNYGYRPYYRYHGW